MEGGETAEKTMYHQLIRKQKFLMAREGGVESGER